MQSLTAPWEVKCRPDLGQREHEPFGSIAAGSWGIRVQCQALRQACSAPSGTPLIVCLSFPSLPLCWSSSVQHVSLICAAPSTMQALISLGPFRGHMETFQDTWRHSSFAAASLVCPSLCLSFPVYTMQMLLPRALARKQHAVSLEAGLGGDAVCNSY